MGEGDERKESRRKRLGAQLERRGRDERGRCTGGEKSEG